MIKSFRERIWFIKGFFRKYILQILLSLGITILVAIVGSVIMAKLPKTKTQYKIGLIGQFTASQLPSTIINFLNAGLVTINDKQEPVPSLSKEWNVENEGTTYTFKLRSDIKWLDNTPVKASDIKISIPNITIETQDPDIIRFKIPTKFSPFPSLLTIPLINEQGKIAGPYDIKLKQKSSGVISQITLESKNKKIIFNVYSTAKQAITAFRLGELDVVLDLSSDTESEVANYGKISKKVNQDKVVMIIFNQTDPNLKDKSVRQGLAYALKDKSFGFEDALTTINSNSWAYNPLIKTYSYNPTRTRELIKAPLVLELSTPPDLLPIADKIKAELDSDLIKINTKVVTSVPDQFQLYLTTYNIPTDPDQYRDWHSTQATNIGKGSDEKLDKLLEDGRVNTDQKERKKIYFDFQKTFSEELPALTLFKSSTITLARKSAYFDIMKPSR